jgi:hypothetical protein
MSSAIMINNAIATATGAAPAPGRFEAAGETAVVRRKL